ncbi:MAG TPA: TIGR02302 family protein, partial [Afifellaceae bacterium]|nr:TIGR02302 family protein [Afifellaceae bacterium]
MDKRPVATERNRLNRLDRAILRAKAALTWEALWPRIVPTLTVIGLFVALSWLGMWRMVPDMMRLALLGLFAAALAYSLYRLFRFELPDEQSAVHRVEVHSGLQHRPASGLRDTLSSVSDDPAAQALWAAHRKRLLAQMENLRAGAPDPEMARRDPNAWRFAVPILLAVAVFVANGEYLTRLGDAFTKVEASVPALASARVDAWIDPPAYTRQPPVFLTRQNAENAASANDALRPSVPEHSVLTVRVVAKDAPRVTVMTDDGNRLEVEPVEPEDSAQAASPSQTATEPAPEASENVASIHTFTTPLGQSGSVEISHSGGAQRHAFVVIDDTPPTIERAEDKDADRTRAGSFTLNFAVTDDFGVVSGNLALALQDPPAEDARPLVELPKVPLRLSRPNAREGLARAYVRMGDHPFAGRTVRIDAGVVDGAGQEGRPTDEITVTLPERRFTNPIARAVVEQRQKLAMDARDQHRVAQALDAMTIAPEEYLKHASIYLGLRIGYKRMVAAGSDDELREMLDYLWQMAVQIEDGALSDAERRLSDARQALEDALDRSASDEEIARLTEELRQAMNEFLQSFAQEMARRDNQSLPQMQMDPSQMMSQQDFQDMLDRIEDLAKLGDRDSAQQLLSELQQMLDSLQMARRGQQQMQDGQSSQMMEQMEELGRLMREQQRLMDDTFGADQGQRPRQRGQQGQQGQQG